MSTPAAVAGAEGFQVVVHPTVQGSVISRAVLSKIFRREIARWGDRTEVLPVDQSARAPVRLAFATQILGQSLGELQQYWVRRMQSDWVVPPPTKGSDREVLAFVASNPGAIGYVTDGITVPPDVKVLTLVN
jgi:ABC-type phosphate transport system substrate-binding protein